MVQGTLFHAAYVLSRRPLTSYLVKMSRGSTYATIVPQKSPPPRPSRPPRPKRDQRKSWSGNKEVWSKQSSGNLRTDDRRSRGSTYATTMPQKPQFRPRQDQKKTSSRNEDELWSKEFSVIFDNPQSADQRSRGSTYATTMPQNSRFRPRQDQKNWSRNEDKFRSKDNPQNADRSGRGSTFANVMPQNSRFRPGQDQKKSWSGSEKEEDHEFLSQQLLERPKPQTDGERRSSKRAWNLTKSRYVTSMLNSLKKNNVSSVFVYMGGAMMCIWAGL